MANVIEPEASTRARSDIRRLESFFVVELSGVFLVNTLVALLSPEDFTGLIGRSPLGRLIPFRDRGWLAPAIGSNDLLIGVALLATIRVGRWRSRVLAWAGVWLFAVSVIKLTALQ